MEQALIQSNLPEQHTSKACLSKIQNSYSQIEKDAQAIFFQVKVFTTLNTIALLTPKQALLIAKTFHQYVLKIIFFITLPKCNLY